ncbi:helix-turn-helix transcriptional regulator [Streptomyces sp. WMMC1477]|uniref:helix-turn-helix transcriptional regulator n=1 Tax=Streptomyces sp. WMMC1477 TaxID=3015155 RepID=UPI0022B6B880|nr:helix-turn-helix domain-containing protein [Streptomyces sp. WMMC1477]MCZ7431949.1 LuxR C-terminal-related transcriptional regulator [Streptomyces sp. WMMC1477]
MSHAPEPGPYGPGLTPEAEALYRALLGVAEGAAARDTAGPDDGRLAELERLGLVGRDAEGVPRARPPRLVLERWAAERELEAVRARETAGELARLYAVHSGAGAQIAEVLEGRETVVGTFEAMQAEARERIRAFERGSYLRPEEVGPNPSQLPAMERGVAYHVIYDAAFLQTDVGRRSLQAAVGAGENARVFPGIPMKLVIADASRALISVPQRSGGGVMALLVHPSMLLDAITGLFEAFWRLAVPVGTGPGRDGAPGGTEPSPDTQRLLALLSAGSTDEAIARDLGVSERTVHRRISRLQELLGARTRFQLGVQAARRGWL